MIVGAAGVLFILQATQSSVTGVVRDGGSGAPLAEAVVSLSDLDRSVATDSLGRYSFNHVPPGPEHLTVRRIGYAPRTLHAFIPDEGQLRIDLSLQPIPQQLATMVVRTTAALRGLEAGDSTRFPDRGVSLAAIRNDPFLAEADGLLALIGGEVAGDPESPSGLHLRGAGSDQIGYLLDGVPVLSPYHSVGLFSAWNPDAIERVQLSSASPSPAYPATLAGTVTAVTRTPGSFLVAQGTMSSSQARVALDGPVGHGGAGFLVSWRAGFPAWAAPRDDSSYVRGELQDALAKLETPLLGGRARLLVYHMGNSIGSSALDASERPLSNDFEWGSRSVGAEWTRQSHGGKLRLQGWSASTEAEASWIGLTSLALTSEREDEGILVAGERSTAASSAAVGVRLERSRTSYRTASLESKAPLYELEASTPVATAFINYERQLAVNLSSVTAVSVSSAPGGVHLNLQNQLRLHTGPFVVSASYVRAHQFSQSLRNSESVVGNIFPAELYAGAGSRGIPVARNDRAILAADYRPASKIRLGIQAYLSQYRGIVLVAPRTAEPFAVDGFTTGSGTAPGISLDAAWQASRYGLLASYSWQRVRLEYQDSTYSPSYGSSHDFELGGIFFPSATSSLRLAVTGALGRRATGVTGDFEWEACNLLDRGCEFGGSPRSNGELGATRLPGYLRVDIGARQHWHLRLGGRDVILALYGTLTNLLGRSNVLTVATDPTGRRTPIEMRPRAPLVVGLDWRF